MNESTQELLATRIVENCATNTLVMLVQAIHDPEKAIGIAERHHFNATFLTHRSDYLAIWLAVGYAAANKVGVPPWHFMQVVVCNALRRVRCYAPGHRLYLEEKTPMQRAAEVGSRWNDDDVIALCTATTHFNPEKFTDAMFRLMALGLMADSLRKADKYPIVKERVA